MPPPSRRLNDKSLNQILTASKSSLVTAGEISNTIASGSGLVLMVYMDTG